MAALEQTREVEKAVLRQTPDQELRRYGFAIFQRPLKGPVLWFRNNRTYTEAEASWQIHQDLKVAAQKAKT